MILVTGGTGFIGRRVVQKLAELGHRQIRCVVRPGTRPDTFAPLLADMPTLEIDLFPVSFNHVMGLREAFKDVDIVYHIAASKQGSAAAQVANTVVGSEAVYQAAVTSAVSRFVLVSSFSVIGVSALSPGAVVDERVPMDKHPEWRDAYSLAKQYQETLAWEYARQHQLPLVVVRPGMVYGPGSDILSLRIGKRIATWFAHVGGRNQLPLTYVDNCAEAIVLAGTVPNIEGEVFCVVDDDLPTSRYILNRYRQEVKSLCVFPMPYRLIKLLSQCNVWYTRRTQGQLKVVYTPYQVDALWKGHRYSNQKAKALLGWKPKIDTLEGLEITFSYLARQTLSTSTEGLAGVGV